MDKSIGSFPWRTVLAVAFPVLVARFVGWGVLTPTAILWHYNLAGDGLDISNLHIPLATFTGIADKHLSRQRFLVDTGSALCIGANP